MVMNMSFSLVVDGPLVWHRFGAYTGPTTGRIGFILQLPLVDGRQSRAYTAGSGDYPSAGSLLTASPWSDNRQLWTYRRHQQILSSSVTFASPSHNRV